MVSGEHFTDAQKTFHGQPVVSFRFDTNGSKRFGKATSENVPTICYWYDKVISAPVIREPILGGSGIISGSFL